MKIYDAYPLRLSYDTSLNPLSFDFVFCLAIARALCDLNKLAPRFDLLIINKGYREVGVEADYTAEYRDKKFLDVIVDTALLCKWVDSVNIVRGDTEVPSYLGPMVPSPEALMDIGTLPQWQITPMVPKQLESLYQQGAKIPDFGFKASQQIRSCYRDRLKNAVVIHPRVSIHTPNRNSDKSITNEIVRLLKADGIPVYFIPDIEDLRNGFTWSDIDAEPIPEAAHDMETRLAVSEVAATNLLYPGGGNVAMLHFSRASFLVTGFFNEAERLSSSAFYAEKGPTVGLNPPWLNPLSQVYNWQAISSSSSIFIYEQLLALLKARRSMTDDN